MLESGIAASIEAMPKIELHVHLEGSVRPSTLIALSDRHGIRLPASTDEQLLEWYSFTSFDHFVEIYLKISECIRTPYDIEQIAWEFLQEQHRQNIIYTEVTYTPYTHFQQKGLTFREQFSALESARLRGIRELGVECRFVFDIARMVTPEEGVVTAKWVLESAPESVAALGLGGPEVGFPPESFIEAFSLIENSPFGSVPHAGETVGPKSVWGALRTLRASRIGHGVRAWEDPKLVEYIKENGIVLEVCPSSNVCIGVYPDIEHHVLPHLVDAGIKVTINSDDPPMFNTTLTDEYKLIADAFGYGLEEFHRFNRTAAEAALARSDKKRELLATIDHFYQPLL